MSDIRTVIVEVVTSAVVNADGAALAEGLSFRDAGVDSLDLANIFLQVEERFGVRISDEDAMRLTDVDKIESFVAERSRATGH
ncbi:MAG TPA: acyl carrier protein [Vicinamibacterales bacterium]|nr:acyl carrier protein [Vicinamibacterales bacterium]